MRFKKLDLNLLVALDALLQERSVSLAADRLSLSQSATSSALGRLREYFADELLTMKGRHMLLTARGEGLLQPVREVLDQIEATIAISQPFDPAVSDRMVSILASDYVLEVLLRPAIIRFAEEAPGMQIEISPLGDDVVEELQRGRADILITIDTAISTELPSVELFRDDYVVVGWSGNPMLVGELTKDLYQQLGHVVTRFGRQRIPSFEEWALKSQSVQRRIEVVAPNFASVGGLLVRSERIATVHRKLARALVKVLPLRIMDVPFEIPGIRLAAQWAQSSDKDPAILWFLQRLRATAAEID